MLSRSVLYLLLLFVVFSCNNTKEKDSKLEVVSAEVSVFGEMISQNGAESVSSLFDNLVGNEKVEGKFEIEITDVCQNKGCWMKAKLPDGSKMHITFKDYSFFVPKNSANKSAVIEGVASIKTTTVEELQHYAKDAGKSQEEIDLITEPKEEVQFIANGVEIINQ
ncbi:MAG: DUF4920 domain-containing protein [Cyclobacteriaceae bacterium]|nr:DUF4920 domain-containing protein [Cyclobacteriaceae bacterium]